VGANTVDVRGQYAEDAVSNVESALARATQYGALYVIHGHGTGRLRTAVREALSAHRFVERLDDAPDNQGGRGCTIAFLKD
jgi:DNA mismatch repair protein MutS2